MISFFSSTVLAASWTQRSRDTRPRRPLSNRIAWPTSDVLGDAGVRLRSNSPWHPEDEGRQGPASFVDTTLQPADSAAYLLYADSEPAPKVRATVKRIKKVKVVKTAIA